MCHDLEDVADSIVVNLSKVPGSVAHVQGAKAEVVFGRSYKMRAVTWTISSISLK
jgi:brefeldin A-resistance guanine nucleotide exchange factor 1